jgi:hypothetical protein
MIAALLIVAIIVSWLILTVILKFAYDAWWKDAFIVSTCVLILGALLMSSLALLDIYTRSNP